MPIANLLTEIVKRTNNSRKEAARLLDISEGYFSLLMSGAREPGDQLHKKIVEASRGKFTFPEDLRIARPAEFRKIPVVSWTTAGLAHSFEDLANQIDELVDATTKDPNAFAIEVVGDSMEGEVHPGDRVVLEPNREASSGDMAYVRFTDEAGGGGTLKWFYRTGQEGRVIRLVAENPEWPTTEHPVQTVKFAYPVHNVIRNRPRKRKP